jgi:HPt (histidine-containing phosphotransfer) domain-containing protein
MEKSIIDALAACGTDVSGALERFAGNEALYEKFLKKFTADATFPNLKAAMEGADDEEKKRAAHSMKGVAANLGFLSLQKAALETETCLKENRAGEARRAFENAEKIYNEITAILRKLS